MPEGPDEHGSYNDARCCKLINTSMYISVKIGVNNKTDINDMNRG